MSNKSNNTANAPEPPEDPGSRRSKSNTDSFRAELPDDYAATNLEADDNGALQKTCFIIMPSGKNGEYPAGEIEANYIFERVLKYAVKTIYGDRINIFRETDILKSGTISRTTIEQISESDIVIIDLTGQNPSVFLTLGLRLGLRPSSTILISQDRNHIPIEGLRHQAIIYSPIFFDLDVFISDLSAVLDAVKTNVNRFDSLIFDILGRQNITLPGVKTINRAK